MICRSCLLVCLKSPRYGGFCESFGLLLSLPNSYSYFSFRCLLLDYISSRSMHHLLTIYLPVTSLTAVDCVSLFELELNFSIWSARSQGKSLINLVYLWSFVN